MVDDGTGTAQGRWELSAAQLPGICKQLTSVVNITIPNILAEIIPGCDDTRRGVLLTVEKAGGRPPAYHQKPSRRPTTRASRR